MIGWFDLDTQKWRAAVASVARQTGQTTNQLLRDIMRLWSEDLVRVTPPTGARQGKDRVRKDIFRLLSPHDDFDSESVRVTFRKRTGADFELGDTGLTVAPGANAGRLRELHEANRDKRGHVFRRVARRYIVRGATLRKYVRDRQEKVGRLKAGWAAAVAATGGKLRGFVAAYVGRFGGGEGGYSDGLNDQTLADGTLEASNAVPYAGRLDNPNWWNLTMRKRLSDLTNGHYAKRWQKRMEAMKVA